VADSTSKIEKNEYYKELLDKTTGSLTKMNGVATEHNLAQCHSYLNGLSGELERLKVPLQQSKEALDKELKQQEDLDNLRLQWSEKAETFKEWAMEICRDLETALACSSLNDVEKLEEELKAASSDCDSKRTNEFSTLQQMNQQCNTGSVVNPYTTLTDEELSDWLNKCCQLVRARKQGLTAERVTQEHHNALRKEYADKAAMFDEWSSKMQEKIVAVGGVGEQSDGVEAVEALRLLTALQSEMELGKHLMASCENADKEMKEASVGLNSYTERTMNLLLQDWGEINAQYSEKQKSLEQYIQLKRNIDSACGRYMDRAGPLKALMATKKAEFEASDLKTLNLEQAQRLHQAAQDFSKGQKVQMLKEKGAVESILSTVQTKVKAAGFPEYHGDEGHSTADISAMWDELTAAERKYADSLSEGLSRLNQDDALKKSIIKKADNMEASVRKVKESLNALDTSRDSSPNCLNFAEGQWKLLQEFDDELIKLSGQMAALEAIVDSQYQTQADAEDVQDKVAMVSMLINPMSELNTLLADKTDVLEQNLVAAQTLDDTRLQYANKAEDFRQALETSDEELTQPIHCGSVNDVSKLQKALGTKRTELEALKEKLLELDQINNQTGAGNPDMNPYTSITLDKISNSYSTTLNHFNNRGQLLDQEMGKQESYNKLRKTFADEAEGFHAWCESLKEKLISGRNSSVSTADQNAQLESVNGLASQITQGETRLKTCEAAQESLNDAGVHENSLAKHSMSELVSEYEMLNNMVNEKRAVLENAIAENSQGLSGEQTAEFRKMFDHFDTDKDGKLKVHEIKAVLASVDVDLPDEKINELLDPTTKSIEFDAFSKFFSELLKDVDTYEQIIDSFKMLSSNKPYITHTDMDVPMYSEYMDPSTIEYLEANMEPMEDVEGGFNYTTYTGIVYGKVASNKTAKTEVSATVAKKLEAAKAEKEARRVEAQKKAEEEARKKAEEEERERQRAEEEERLKQEAIKEAEEAKEAARLAAAEAEKAERARSGTVQAQQEQAARRASVIQTAKAEAIVKAQKESDEAKAKSDEKLAEDKARRQVEEEAAAKAAQEQVALKAKQEEEARQTRLTQLKSAGKKGELWKKGAGTGMFSRRNWNKRVFVCTEQGILKYYKDERAVDSGACSGEIDLKKAGTFVREEPPHSDKAFCFALEFASLDQEPFVMCADTPTERAEWLELLSLWVMFKTSA